MYGLSPGTLTDVPDEGRVQLELGQGSEAALHGRRPSVGFPEARSVSPGDAPRPGPPMRGLRPPRPRRRPGFEQDIHTECEAAYVARQRRFNTASQVGRVSCRRHPPGACCASFGPDLGHVCRHGSGQSSEEDLTGGHDMNGQRGRPLSLQNVRLRLPYAHHGSSREMATQRKEKSP